MAESAHAQQVKNMPLQERTPVASAGKLSYGMSVYFEENLKLFGYRRNSILREVSIHTAWFKPVCFYGKFLPVARLSRRKARPCKEALHEKRRT